MKRLSLLLSVLVFLAGCSGFKSCGAGKGSSKSLPDTFIWNNHTEPPTLDPGLATDSVSSNVLIQLFEGLTEYHPKTQQPMPAMATHWKISEDGKIYTFYLRKNAKWSNGDPVTADDFVFSWKRVLKPSLASEYAYILYSIVGAEDYNTGKTKTADDVAVKALDPHTLQVTLQNPTPYFTQLITFKTFRPVHRKTVEQWKEMWTRPEHYVSNGPYHLVSWVPQKEVIVEKNPHYWDLVNVRINRIKFLPIEDLETGLKLCLNKEVHFCDDLPAVKIPQLKSVPGFQAAPMLGTYFYYINVKKPGLSDKRVRHALNMAIDKQKLVEVIKTGAKAAPALVPVGVGSYISPKGDEYNPEKARALLAEAGYSDPKKFPKFSIYYNTSESHKMVAEIIQNMWKQNLGIEVGILNQEWKILLKNYTALSYDIGRMGWIGDYVDPHTFLDQFTTNSQQNRTGWSNPAYDVLVNTEQAQEPNIAKRNEILKKAEVIFLDDLPVIPIYFYYRSAIIDTRLKEFYVNLQDMHPAKFAYFE